MVPEMVKIEKNSREMESAEITEEGKYLAQPPALVALAFCLCWKCIRETGPDQRFEYDARSLESTHGLVYYSVGGNACLWMYEGPTSPLSA